MTEATNTATNEGTATVMDIASQTSTPIAPQAAPKPAAPTVDTSTATPITRMEIRLPNGRVLVYEFDTITLIQMKYAETVYNTLADVLKDPPRTLDQAVALGVHNAELRCASWLLRWKDESTGEPEAHAGIAYADAILTSLEQLRIGEAEKIKKVVEDFFGQTGHGMTIWLVQQRQTIEAVALFGQQMQRATSQASNFDEKLPLGTNGSLVPETPNTPD